MDIQFPVTIPALRVDQRLGSFYVAVLPAELLLRVCASDRMSASLNPDGVGYSLEGTQRVIKDNRLSEIAAYINRVDAAFPNSIIVAANYDRETGFDQAENEDIAAEEGEESGAVSSAWSVQVLDDGCHKLTIPSEAKLAAVIDGQHRLFSFAKANPEALQSMNLICSVFIDLPKALQAQIFATINSTQKRVDRSLTFELFGYNVSDEPEEYWTPDKLAVFFARKLATDTDSPLRGRIMVAPKRDSKLEKIASEATWRISTAVAVDGIMRLYSSNPKRDANLMREGDAHTRDVLLEGPKDKSPLRSAYVEGNDAVIFKMVLNYLKAADSVFWENANEGSYIFRTIGVQAIFDILRKLASDAFEERNISSGYFEKILTPAKEIDFSSTEFQNASGSGRTFIRKAIEGAIGI
ncbi:DNA phosphorothioation-associated DGQHR protein 1 [uncultured Tateyamaria sp.]|uniref:DNA phosphorothioation-associated DGQHR protein 1 n=1 Tax=uncultured Tateyamaria sp. TaxID=455651 RepID=UPI00260FFE45|nr:DNA phosphorothioation-associated DGQHR protein 1 [uncultured Tateyamaria sp.]